MRIALLTEVFLPKIDGVVTRTTRHLDQLAALGHEVLIFAPGTPPAEYAGFEVVPIRSHSLKVYPEVKHGMLGPKTYRRLREFNPDIVHAVNPIWTAGWSTLVVARRFPVIASFHTDVPEYCLKLGIPWVKPIAEWGLRTFHGRAGLNLVTSGPMMDKAADYGISNVRLWPKAVDTESFTPAARTREMRSLLSDGHPDAPWSSSSAASRRRNPWTAVSPSSKRCADVCPTRGWRLWARARFTTSSAPTRPPGPPSPGTCPERTCTCLLYTSDAADE